MLFILYAPTPVCFTNGDVPVNVAEKVAFSPVLALTVKLVITALPLSTPVVAGAQLSYCAWSKPLVS